MNMFTGLPAHLCDLCTSVFLIFIFTTMNFVAEKVCYCALQTGFG